MRLTRRALLWCAVPAGASGAPAQPCPPPVVGGVQHSPCRLAGGVYETGFDRDEFPLSEGGRWVHLDRTLTPCQAIGGVAFGTQKGGAYDDSNVYMTGFGPDHEVEGRVWLRPGVPESPNREVEILLRWRDSGRLRHTRYGANRATGYEINWSHVGAYLILGRFKGAELARAQVRRRPRNGDRLRARIVGQRIQAWINDEQVIDHVDDHPHLRFTEGHPGIGFYIDAGASCTDFGFDAVTVRAL